MASGPNFGPREREVLNAIIEAYIITGEPIGSRGLSRRFRANSDRWGCGSPQSDWIAGVKM